MYRSQNLEAPGPSPLYVGGWLTHLETRASTTLITVPNLGALSDAFV